MLKVRHVKVEVWSKVYGGGGHSWSRMVNALLTWAKSAGDWAVIIWNVYRFMAFVGRPRSTSTFTYEHVRRLTAIHWKLNQESKTTSRLSGNLYYQLICFSWFSRISYKSCVSNTRQTENVQLQSSWLFIHGRSGHRHWQVATSRVPPL